MLGISALHLLAASMVVSDRGEMFAPAVISFDCVLALGLALVAGDVRVAAPWLIALAPLTITVVAPRVGLALLGLLPTTMGLAWALLGVFHVEPALTPGRVATYAVLGLGAGLASTAVLIFEVGWAMRWRVREEQTRVQELEVLTEHAPIGLAIQDLQHRFVYTNPRLRDILGLTSDEIERSGLTNAVPPDVLDRIEPTIIDAQLRRQSVRFEHAFRRPDGGGLGWLEVSMSEPLQLSDATSFFVFSIIDSTAKISATIRSRRFSQALDVTSDLVLLWDTLRRPLHTNAAFLRFFGEDQRDTAVEQVLDVVEAHIPTWATLPGRSSSGFEAEFMSRSGRVIPFSIVVTVAQDAHLGARSFALLARDISAQRRVSEELRDVVRSKDQFIASVSHQLRTPLAVVLGLATELAENVGTFSHAETAELSRLVAEQSAEVTSIVEDLLMVARADAGALVVDPSPTPLGPLVDEVVRTVPGAGAVSVASGLDALVRADRARLSQIIRHLLKNGLRHGGGDVQIDARSSVGRVEIIVSDAGAPISAAVQDTMFEVYGRGHPSSSGPDSMGLGLTVSRTLARLMDGDVVYRRVGDRSEFVVELPAGEPSVVVDDRDRVPEAVMNEAAAHEPAVDDSAQDRAGLDGC